MSVNDGQLPGRLSRAGREALTEHLDAEKDRILAEATRLSDGAPLSAFDIVNAVDLLSTRDSRDAPTHRYSQYRSERSKWSSMLLLYGTLVLTVIAAAAGLFILTIGDASSPKPWPDAVLSVVVGALGVMSGSLIALAIASIARSNRNSRDFQRRLEEHDMAFEPARIPWKMHDSSLRSTGSFVTNWILLENDLRDVGSESLGIPSEDARRYPIGELLRMLVKAGYLSDNDYEITRGLLTLRNEVVHGRDFDPDDLQKAEKVIADLRLRLGSSGHRAARK